jgi:hypothetical protein
MQEGQNGLTPRHECNKGSGTRSSSPTARSPASSRYTYHMYHIPSPSPPKTARESSDGVRPDLPSLITRAVVFQSFDLAASLSPPHHSFPATFPPLSVLDHDSTSPRPLHPPHVAYVVQVSILERLQQRIVCDSELLPITVHTSGSLPVRTTSSSTQGHPPASQAPQLACRLRRGRRDCSRSGR